MALLVHRILSITKDHHACYGILYTCSTPGKHRASVHIMVEEFMHDACMHTVKTDWLF